jgi:ABC-type nickel/cobalt efflux system permease component RcnA
MRDLALPILLGLLLGLRHAFEPDHLAAVAALMGRTGKVGRFKAGRVGAMWGAGHACALLAAGSTVILLGWRVPPRLEAFLELAVAAVLILLGGRILWHHLRQDRAHLHLHEHDGVRHAHLHFHHGEGHAEHHHRHPVQQWLGPSRRPFLVGMIHGLSGTGAATLLVLAASSSAASALLALALFASGALLGMAALSWILSLPLSAAQTSSIRFFGALQLTSGVICLMVGMGLAGRTLSGL